jgi:hypothetical protein
MRVVVFGASGVQGAAQVSSFNIVWELNLIFVGGSTH